MEQGSWMNWFGQGATPQQIGSNLDFLMRLTDPVLQMQGVAQYLAWLNEAMRQDRILASQMDKQRNEQLRELKLLEEQMRRNQAILEADARKLERERIATMMQGIGNLAKFFSDFLNEHPNLFKRPSRSRSATQKSTANTAINPTPPRTPNPLLPRSPIDEIITF